VRFRPVVLSKIPDVDEISVQNDKFGIDRVEILKKFDRVTANRTQMDIGQNNSVDVS